MTRGLHAWGKETQAEKCVMKLRTKLAHPCEQDFGMEDMTDVTHLPQSMPFPLGMKAL